MVQAVALLLAVTLNATGSSLLSPLFRSWAAAYERAHSGVHIVVRRSDSGRAIAAVLSGSAQIGLSDAYMSDAQLRAHPQLLNVPVAISALQIVYNLPGLNAFPGSLRLSGPVLAGIYTGRVRFWNDAAIAALNPGIALPHRAIVPVRRSDASGSTFVFTQFLSFSTPWWDRSYDVSEAPVWPPVEGARTANASTDMVRTVAATPYAIGYAGISVADEAARDGLGTAWIQNADGEFTLPTAQSIAAAATHLAGRTPSDERLTLAFAKGPQSYPLVNYEYAIVSQHQRDSATAAAVRDFLTWCITPSDERAHYLNAVHFIGLPPHTWELGQAQIATIH